MSLEVIYGEYKKPQVATQYPIDIWDISDVGKDHMYSHLRKVVAVSCFKEGVDSKRAVEAITIETIATGAIDGNTVMWVGCDIEGKKRRVLINTPQLKSFEPYFIDGKIIDRAMAVLSPWGQWGFYRLEEGQ